METLLHDCSDLELFGHVSAGKTSGRPFTWFRIRSDDDWPLVNSLFLKNIRRPDRNPSLFES